MLRSNAPKAPNVVARANGPGSGASFSSRSAESATYVVQGPQRIRRRFLQCRIPFRAFSALLISPPPGPLGRAIAFSAFGAAYERMFLAGLGESDVLSLP